MSAQTPVPSLLRSFFEDYLAAQRDVSQNTIYTYRDAIKLFLRLAARHRGRQLLRLQFADLGADTVLAFLTYLESDRKNSAATRNCRLVAIHRLFAYAADQDPRHAQLCRRGATPAMASISSCCRLCRHRLAEYRRWDGRGYLMSAQRRRVLGGRTGTRVHNPAVTGQR